MVNLISVIFFFVIVAFSGRTVIVIVVTTNENQVVYYCHRHCVRSCYHHNLFFVSIIHGPLCFNCLFFVYDYHICMQRCWIYFFSPHPTAGSGFQTFLETLDGRKRERERECVTFLDVFIVRSLVFHLSFTSFPTSVNHTPFAFLFRK